MPKVSKTMELKVDVWKRNYHPIKINVAPVESLNSFGYLSVYVSLYHRALMRVLSL